MKFRRFFDSLNHNATRESVVGGLTEGVVSALLSALLVGL